MRRRRKRSPLPLAFLICLGGIILVWPPVGFAVLFLFMFSEWRAWANARRPPVRARRR